MKSLIGYVHFRGQMGDLIRVQAVRRFFDEQGIAYKEFVLTHHRPDVDIMREAFSPSGVRNLTRKLFINRAHPFIKEMNWHIEVRQWEESVDAGARELIGQAPQIDIFHAELIAGGLVCARIKALSGKPYVYDMHGIISEEAKLTGSEEYATACNRWEREVVRNADWIIVVTEAIRQYVHQVHGVALEKIVLCPNGTYLNDVQARFSNPLNVVYAGNFAAYENVMSFVKTAELMASERIRFVLMGDGAERNELFDYINRHSVDIVYLGKKRYEQVLNILARMQVGFFGQSGGTAMTGSPLKLLDYASCGLPILSGPGPWAGPIQRFNCGVIVRDTSPEEFARGIEQFTDRESWESMSRNAKSMVRQMFQWKDVLGPLKDLYDSVS